MARAMSQTILVTGGAGYIGSHACVCLLEAGFDVVVVDNLSNGSPLALERVQAITGKTLHFYQGDLRDRAFLETVFARHAFAAALHFAGLKSVTESLSEPLAYYDNNIIGSLVLLDVMQQHGVWRLIFSSSATVYGDAEQIPVPEDAPLSTNNPYGSTKLQLERVFSDCAAATGAKWQVALLRYFNPAGAHPSGLIGEDPQGIPNNLLPYVARVAAGQLPELSVFGDDYATVDGTGVRDFIHVVDLAEGHVAALNKLLELPTGAFCRVYNLGTGRGYSVLEAVHTFEKVSGRPVPYKICPRRTGDIAVSYADCSRAKAELNWQASRGLEEMLADSWRWQRDNPNGFSKH